MCLRTYTWKSRGFLLGSSYWVALWQAWRSPASLGFPLSVPAACGCHEIDHLKEKLNSFTTIEIVSRNPGDALVHEGRVVPINGVNDFCGQVFRFGNRHIWIPTYYFVVSLLPCNLQYFVTHDKGNSFPVYLDRTRMLLILVMYRTNPGFE